MSSLTPGPSRCCDSASTTLVFPPCASFEKPYDLDIVRKIVEREGCLEALQQLLAKAIKPQQPRISGISKAPMVFQSVIDQLRSVSVQIVEDIDQWQKKQKAKAQATTFKWRGVNYLLKMTSDLDFLTSFRGVALMESLQTRNQQFRCMEIGSAMSVYNAYSLRQSCYSVNEKQKPIVDRFD
ncbi:hypothetical protein PC112_g15552 [Phytophthora cactorum]|nr:hypothetical protein PC112_g15552 [Phytophthora cactorum]KAG3148341.1 hypothetical protein C6341_g17435 [Phytophthora cactorum]